MSAEERATPELPICILARDFHAVSASGRARARRRERPSGQGAHPARGSNLGRALSACSSRCGGAWAGRIRSSGAVLRRGGEPPRRRGRQDQKFPGSQGAAGVVGRFLVRVAASEGVASSARVPRLCHFSAICNPIAKHTSPGASIGGIGSAHLRSVNSHDGGERPRSRPGGPAFGRRGCVAARSRRVIASPRRRLQRCVNASCRQLRRDGCDF